MAKKRNAFDEAVSLFNQVKSGVGSFVQKPMNISPNIQQRVQPINWGQVAQSVRNFVSRPITAPNIGTTQPNFQAAQQFYQQQVQPRLQPIINRVAQQPLPIQNYTPFKLPTIGQTVNKLGENVRQSITKTGELARIVGTPTSQMTPQQKQTFEENIPLIVGNMGGFAKPALSKFSNYLAKTADKEAIKKIMDFVIDVQKTGGKKNYGTLGQEIASIAKDVYGSNIERLSNRQLANLLDATLKQVGTKSNKFSLGLVTEDIRQGTKPVAKAGLYDTGMTLYRGGELDLSKGRNQGISFTKDPEVAKTFPVKSPIGNAQEFAINPKAKILSFDDIPNKFKTYSEANKVTVANQDLLKSGQEEYQAIVDYARKQGYDAVDLSGFYAKGYKGQGLGEQEIRVLNPKAIQSRVAQHPTGTSAVASPTIDDIPLRKNRPGAYTNVPEIDNPLIQKGAQGAENAISQAKPLQIKPQLKARLAIPSRLTPADSLQEIQRVRQTVDSQGQRVGKSFDDIINQEPINVKQKIGILDYLRTPDRILEKIGLGQQSKQLRGAYDTYLKELPVEIDKITKWSKQVPPESNQKIFQYLDGQNIKLNPQELKVASEVKQYLKGWADRLGLPEDKRITNYITHIFDRELIQKEFDPEIANLIRDKVAGSVYDPFTEQRLGKLGYIEDTWRALDAYVKRATRKANLDPILKQIKGASEGLEQSQYNYVKNYIDRVNMRPTGFDNLLDNTIKQIVGYKFGQRPTTVLTKGIRQMVYRGTLGLNVGSALRNLTQGVNTYAKLGEKYTILGYTNLAKSILSKSDELERVGVLKNDFIQDRTISATKKFWETADKGLFSLFELAEKVNRGSAYFGAKAKAIGQGMDETQAIEYAKKMVRDTQFTFGSIDTPLALQNDVVKFFTQFQSFNLKQSEFLGEMIKNKDAAGLIRFTLASLATVFTVGQVIGLKPQDIIPFSGILTGQTKLGETPAIQAVGKLKDAVFGGTDTYGNELSPKDRVGKVVDAAIPFIPAGVQAKKTFQGLDTVRKGYSESKTGRVQYVVPQDTGTTIKAGLFGKNNLPQAQEYFNNNISVLGENQSELVKQSSDRQGTYSKIIQNRQNTQVLNKAKEELKSGFSQTTTVGNKVLVLQNDGSVKTYNSRQEADIGIAKEKVKQSGGVEEVAGNIIYMKNGQVKTIDISTPITPPKLTGYSDIDKTLLSHYSSQLTSEINNLIELVSIGKLTPQQANELIAPIKAEQQQIKIKTAKPKKPKAPKKIQVRKVTARKTSFKPLKIKIKTRPLKIERRKI